MINLNFMYTKNYKYCNTILGTLNKPQSSGMKDVRNTLVSDKKGGEKSSDTFLPQSRPVSGSCHHYSTRNNDYNFLKHFLLAKGLNYVS